MEKVTLLPPSALSDGWISPEFLPEGKDKYYIRNLQVKHPQGGWRHLRSEEIEELVNGGNTAANWDTVWVTDSFCPHLVRHSNFFGTVRIGRITPGALQFHDLRLPVGITGSSIHSCDIGDDCAIHDVHYLSHYIISDRCILFNIQEMSTTNHAKFGNGIVKDGEDEDVRVQLEIMNETGSRKVCPFDGIITSDAYLWGKYIDDKTLQSRLLTITQDTFDHHRGYYGTVGEGCVIKTSEIIKDVKIGPCCYIKGASKLKNITINSSDKEPSQIGENVILVNGIVGHGSRIFYGSIAVKFVIGVNCNLKYGARLIDSILGDNSTISCCEVLNNLIFPAHEQHHNNSFLIASCIGGQSNMAAGATIGSNHNSRTNDNELVAGRGFWPALCVSIKHSSVFACYSLLAKGAYPYELNIPLPFSMTSNTEKSLEIMPAFWWMHNMYALARNSWKYCSRDRRITKTQNIEFDTYAPDSMQQVVEARRLLEIWTAKAWLRSYDEGTQGKDLASIGRDLLEDETNMVERLEILGENIEKSSRPVHIRHVREGYRSYGEMIVHYAVMNALNFLENHPGKGLGDIPAPAREGENWVNLGGQLVREADIDDLRKDICSGKINSWEAIHARYNELWERYPIDKLTHACRALCSYMGTSNLTAEHWKQAFTQEIKIQQYICEAVRSTREKDYDNLFRKATYRNEDEMLASVGRLDNNSFVQQMLSDTEKNISRIKKYLFGL